MVDFYGTGIEIWAGFGLVGTIEKKHLGQLRATFEARFFKFSGTVSVFGDFCPKIIFHSKGS